MASKFKQLIHTFLLHITPSCHAWRGAAAGLSTATLIAFLLSAWELLEEKTPLLEASLYLFSGLLALTLLGVLFVFFFFLFQRIPGIYKWALVCFVLTIFFFFIPPLTFFGVSLITLWTITGFSLMGGALGVLVSELSAQKKMFHFKPLLFLFIGIAVSGFLGVWLFRNTNTFVPDPHLLSKVASPYIPLSDPALPGPYAIKTLTYGSGKDLHRPEYGQKTILTTPSVDGSPFIKDWDGLSGWLRTRYWGFDIDELPLNGRVWYPDGAGPFPLVVIVHGNHEMTAPSDKGYAYLGELLASRGFITASIDQNFLNGAWHSNLSEAPGRGWLLLEHLKLWRAWNTEEVNPFYQKIDMQRIALIGHSRGGEAVAAAAALNPLTHYPGNGNIHLDYGFNLRGLIAIAPVDAQFKPGGINIQLENIDYFVIQGSHDGDVRTFEGSAQFHRIHFSGSPYHFKAALYIWGANHGQFNTIWGNKDTPAPLVELFDLGQIMPAEQQQQIAKVYISAFLETSLNHQLAFLPLFQSYRSGQQWLPQTFYLNEFGDSTFQYIDNDDKTDIDITKTSIPGGTQEGENLKIWRQGRLLLKDGSPIQIGIFLGWDHSDEKKPPAFVIHLPESGIQVSEASILVIDAANGNEAENNQVIEDEEAIDGKVRQSIFSGSLPIDFSIEITDANGHSAALPFKRFGYLPPIPDPKIMKAAFLDSLTDSEYVFQTFEFPIVQFIIQNPSLDPKTLKTIRLIFDQTPEGVMILDSIAFRSAKE